MKVQLLRDKLSSLQTLLKIEPILESFSTEEKYIAHLEGGRKYVLKVAPANDYEKKKIEFHLLDDLYKNGVRCSKPIDYGYVADSSYLLLSYIEGVKAECPFIMSVTVTKCECLIS
jgi:hypothetical protein